MTLKNLIKEFNQEIISIREFVELISPVVKGNSLKTLKSNEEALIPLFATVTKQNLQDRIEELKTKIATPIPEDESKAAEKELEELNESLDKVNRDLKKYDKINLSVESVEEEGDHKKASIKIEGDLKLFDSGMNEMKKAVDKVELLYRASFITLTSTCEFFLSRLLHFYYDLYPESAGIKDKSLTLEDLKSFNSVDDAERFLIEKKVEQILRSELKNWFEVLKKELKLSLGYYESLKDELIECFQRRNILVHNGGKVNSIYHSKVSESYKTKYEIDEKLVVDEKYLDQKICQIHLVFLLVAFELWKKKDKDDEERAETLIEIAYENMINKKWEVAKGLSYFLMGDKSQPSISQTVATLNYWLSIKRIGKFEEIKSELEKADYSDKSAVFRMALSSLKEDKEQFFRLLPQALKYEDLTIAGLFEFPVFEEMRETEEFKKYLKDNNIQKPNEEVKKVFNPKSKSNGKHPQSTRNRRKRRK